MSAVGPVVVNEEEYAQETFQGLGSTSSADDTAQPTTHHHTPPLYISPLKKDDYMENFVMGDIAEMYHAQAVRDPMAYKGNWQVMLKRSDSTEAILFALGINVVKRKIMNMYESITDVEVEKTNPNDDQQPSMKMITHLPLHSTKSVSIKFNDSWSSLKDMDTGEWKTRSVYCHGRALQRREGKLGVMFDVRCIFNEDPADIEDPNRWDGPVMLFKWTFVMPGKNLIVVNRWLKKI